MIAWSMAQIALMGALLALAAFGAEAALRAAGRPTRWAWVGALMVTLTLAALVPLRRADTPAPGLTVSSTVATTITPTDVEPSGLLVTLASIWTSITAGANDIARDALTMWHTTVPVGTERVLLVAWGAASVTLLLIFAGVHLRFARRRAQWPVGTLHNTPVRIADDTGPAVIGVTRAEIVVPQWLLSRDDREQQLVLSHEREHVRLRDPLLLAMAQAAIVLLPWHPAVWWMAARLRLAVELDCDRRVLQRGVNARDYGTLLIDLTDHRSGFGAALPAFSCTPSHLERRLIAMTPKKLRYPLVRALTAGTFASLALLAACEAKLPTDAEVEGMTAQTAVTAVLGKAAYDANAIVYYVDSVRVTKDEANKLAPQRIASVHVEQGKTPGAGTVYIETVEHAKTLTGAASRPSVDVARDSKPVVSTPNPGQVVTVSGPHAQSSFAGATRDASGAVIKDNGFDGLLVVDGVITPAEQVNTIDPSRIESVSIVKGPAATAKYTDPRATKGVIEIVTKKAAAKP